LYPEVVVPVFLLACRCTASFFLPPCSSVFCSLLNWTRVGILLLRLLCFLLPPPILGPWAQCLPSDLAFGSALGAVSDCEESVAYSPLRPLQADSLKIAFLSAATILHCSSARTDLPGRVGSLFELMRWVLRIDHSPPLLAACSEDGGSSVSKMPSLWRPSSLRVGRARLLNFVL